MKKKILCIVLSGVLASVVLAGCGDGSESVQGSTQAMEVTGEPIPTDTELGIMNYEKMYSEGTLTAEDYKELARLYAQEGRIREQRDMLEQCRRLYQDEEALGLLQGIAVNAAEESGEIRDQMDILYQALEIPEYLDDGVNAMVTDAWFSTMMPKLREGKRSYFLQKDEQSPSLYVEAGYGADGLPYGLAWFVQGDGQAVSLYRSGTALRWVRTALADGGYQGDFESWLFIGSTGDIYHETGTLAQGLLNGEYTAQVHTGEAASDLFSLWSNREGMVYTPYTGAFENGRAAAEQPSEAARKKALGEGVEGDLLAYAYDEGKENYLFVTVSGEADAAAYAFDIAAMGLAAYPGFTYYEALQDGQQDSAEAGDGSAAEPGGGNAADVGGGAETGTSGAADGAPADGGKQQSGAEATDGSAPQIRIYDSEIQWFDGKRWASLGTVGSYQLDDPFRLYAEEKAAADAAYGSQGQTGAEGEGAAAAVGGGMLADRLGRRGAAAVEKPKEPAGKPNTGSKPNTGAQPTTPANKPAQPATPVTPPAQEPAPPQDNGGGNNGGDNGGGDNGGDNGGNNNGGGDNGGGSGGDSGGNSGGDSGSSGGDVDIEWTDDIL